MRKKKVGIITFHASHNYGSMLQAYALQQTMFNMGYDCEIINFRTKRQKKMYHPLFSYGSLLGTFKRFILSLMHLKSLWVKYRLFESFLNDYLKLTSKEYATLDELEKESFSFDIFISGSDQIWNTHCRDFDWAYFLPFCKKGNKIAYAPSMGPCPEEEVLDDNSEFISNYLCQYDAISVREERTGKRIRDFLNIDCQLTLDPTLLLSLKEWEVLIDEKPIIKGDYIFLYTPFYYEKAYVEAEKLSHKYNMKVVVSQMFYDISCLKFHFEYYLAAGPKEFLNLCKNAKLVCGYSFHLVVFSLFFKVPFIAIDGKKDSRIMNLLTCLGAGINDDGTNNICIDINEIEKDLQCSYMILKSRDWLNANI